MTDNEDVRRGLDELQAVDNASEDEHMVLGTVAATMEGFVLVVVDHLEVVPTMGDRVKIVKDWD